MLRTGLLATVSIAAVFCAGNAAAAQTASQAPAPANSAVSDPTQPGEIGEIIVTAQKRSERISTVPLSITAVSPALLNSTASKNLVELQGIVPGVTFPAPTSYGGSPIVIRGTSGQGTFLEDDPVAVYVDGIYQASNSRFGVSDLTDVQSVEIVRGPQGTLQGRNATAGAILVHTTDPGTSLAGFVRASLAAPYEYRTEAALSVPVSETFDIRLSGDHFYQQGYATNLSDGRHLGGQEATNLRAVLLWHPGSRFTARLALNYQYLANNQAAARWAYTAVNPAGQAVTAPTPYVSLPDALQQQYLDKRLDTNVQSRNVQQSPNAALELHYALGGAEVVSLTGISKAVNTGMTDSDGLGTVGTNGVSLVDAVTGQLRQAYNQGHITGDQETEELRVQSTGNGNFKWLLGAYGSRAYDQFTFNIFNLKESVASNQIIGFQAHQFGYSGAVFADGTYKLTPQLSVTGGLRYTKESKLFQNAFSITNFNSGFTFVGPVVYAPPRSTFNDVSYRAGLNYQATRDLLVYASYSKGYKSGGFNAFGVGPNPAFQPEKLYSAEIGLKSYFMDHKGYVALSAYHNNYNNLQVTAGVPTGGVIIQNAASAKIKGFEIEGRYKLTDQLSLSANAAYTNANYTQFQNAQAVDGSLVNASGNRLPNTPKWQYYVQGDYAVALSPDWKGAASVSWRWRDTINFFGTNATPNLQGAADGEFGARLELTHTRSQVTVALYGKNLNNKRVVAAEQVQFGYPLAFFNQPRVVGIQLAKAF